MISGRQQPPGSSQGVKITQTSRRGAASSSVFFCEECRHSEPRSAQLTVPVLSEPLTQPRPPPHFMHAATGPTATEHNRKLFILATALFYNSGDGMSGKNLLSFLRRPARWFHTVCNSREREMESSAAVSSSPRGRSPPLGLDSHSPHWEARPPSHVPLRQKRGPAEVAITPERPALHAGAMTHVQARKHLPCPSDAAVTSPLSFWTRDRNHYPPPPPHSPHPISF